MNTKLQKINACSLGAEWADNQDSYKSAWDNCQRGDWMLWVARKANVDLKALTRAKVECAKTVEHLMKDKRSINALRAAERFAIGRASIDELNSAANAAYAAANAAYAAANAAADAAYAAADTADTADTADYAAYAAANAAYAAAYAADYAADAAADTADYAAANAADYAADAAADTADYAANAAANAAYAAANAADYAADAAYARDNILKTCADICRRHISFDDIQKYLDEV